MSGKKRVSVFARLGPAGPPSPDEVIMMCMCLCNKLLACAQFYVRARFAVLCVLELDLSAIGFDESLSHVARVSIRRCSTNSTMFALKGCIDIIIVVPNLVSLIVLQHAQICSFFSSFQGLSSHSRYNVDKHMEKGHHSHTVTPHSSHTHSGSRDDSTRERKSRYNNIILHINFDSDFS